jgi:small-conductance mechanosensitive channel
MIELDALDAFAARLAEPRGWWSVLLVALLAVALAGMVHWVGVRLLRRVVVRSPVATAVLGRTVAPIAWVLPLIALQVAWQVAPDTLPGLATVRHLTAIALIAAVAWGLVAAIHGVERAVGLARPVHGTDDFGARRLHTQIRVLSRTASFVVLLLAAALMLITFPAVRHIGASLLASAGLAGIVAGLAARPVLGNLIAGLQIGLAQPIRLDDVVIVENEWGVIEEITGTFVVIRLWDERRMVVPLQWWIEHPFQNWTRSSTQLIGSVFLWVDYRMPIEPLRDALRRACEASSEWDRRVAVLQVTEAGERALQLRALVSARDAGKAWDLRCRVREELVAFIQREYPEYLPRVRAESRVEPGSGSGSGSGSDDDMPPGRPHGDPQLAVAAAARDGPTR